MVAIAATEHHRRRASQLFTSDDFKNWALQHHNHAILPWNAAGYSIMWKLRTVRVKLPYKKNYKPGSHTIFFCLDRGLKYATNKFKIQSKLATQSKHKNIDEHAIRYDDLQTVQLIRQSKLKKSVKEKNSGVQNPEENLRKNTRVKKSAGK